MAKNGDAKGAPAIAPVGRRGSLPLLLLAGAIGLFALAIIYNVLVIQPQQQAALLERQRLLLEQQRDAVAETIKAHTTPGGAISSTPLTNSTTPPFQPPPSTATTTTIPDRTAFITILIPALGTLGMGIFTTYSQYWKKQDLKPLYDSLYSSKTDMAEVMRRLDDLRQIVNRDVVMTEANKENISQLEAAIKDLENEIERYKDAVDERISRLSERVSVTEYRERDRPERPRKPRSGAPFDSRNQSS